MAQLLGSESFVGDCIGKLAGDIELNFDRRYPGQTDDIKAALRGRLEKAFKGAIIETQRTDPTIPFDCDELKHQPDRAEIHVSLATGAHEEFAEASFVIRTALGVCKKRSVIIGRGSFQCPGAVPYRPPPRLTSRPTGTPRSVDSREPRRGPTLKLWRDDPRWARGMFGATIIFTAASIGTRVTSIVQYAEGNDYTAATVSSGVLWITALGFAGPTGYQMSRHQFPGRLRRRHVLGFGIGGGALLVSGIVLKGTAWGYEGVDTQFFGPAALYADVASITGLGMISAAIDSHLIVRPTANGLALAGRF